MHPAFMQNLPTKITKWLWEHLGNIVMLSGWAMSFAVPAWAVHATKLFQEFAPASWVAAGFLGMVLAGTGWALWQKGRLWRTNRHIRESFYRESDRINPMSDLFRHQRLAIADLVSPFDHTIKNKTFLDCEIIGPANILLNERQPGEINLSGSEFPRSDAVLLHDDSTVFNSVTIENCTFTRCKFWKCTLFFRASIYETANRRISGLNWVTITPDHPFDYTLFEDDRVLDEDADTDEDIMAALGFDPNEKPG